MVGFLQTFFRVLSDYYLGVREGYHNAFIRVLPQLYKFYKGYRRMLKAV